MKNKKLVFRIGVDAGFFSEFNNMIFALHYCKVHRISFILNSSEANFSFNKGWTDFFEPFCKQDNFWLHKRFNNRLAPPVVVRIRDKVFYQWYLAYLRLKGIDLITYQVLLPAREQDVEGVYTFFDGSLNGKFVQNCRQLVQQVWQINKETQLEIKKRTRVITHLPKEFVSVHIRRGDKVIKETKATDIYTYMEQVSSRSACRHVFVATDDYQVYEDLVVHYPTYSFYTLATKENRGYDQPAFEKFNKQMKKDEMLNLLTTISILEKSTLFIGTFTSNIGLFMHLRMPEGTCFSVEKSFNIW